MDRIGPAGTREGAGNRESALDAGGWEIMETEGEPRSGEDEGARGEGDVIALHVLELADRAPARAGPIQQDDRSTVQMIRPDPVPRKTYVGQENNGGWVSSITRLWNPGDTDRCQRCPIGTCCADHEENLCTYQVKGFVEDDEGWDHSPAKIPGFRWSADGRLGLVDEAAAGAAGTG
jgi:hypothetical protein